MLAGQNHNRQLPAFFSQAFDVPVTRMASPGFAMRRGRGVSLPATILQTLRELPSYRTSLALIGSKIALAQPDLVVNFLEPLMGYYNWRYRPAVPTLAVGHQFMMAHPGFPRLARWHPERLGMSWYVGLTGARAARLALSFYQAPDRPEQRLQVCPPILRHQLFTLPAPRAGHYLLIYLLNHGYAEDIRQWHRAHPEVPLHCFYDLPGAPEEERVDATLTFHRLHGEKFLHMMGSCRGVACSAGFESVSEAAYLGKPLLMVPTEHHFEQALNAQDAEQAGLGMRDTRFRLERLLAAPDTSALGAFRRWTERAETICLRAVEAAVSGPVRQSSRVCNLAAAAETREAGTLPS